jgi:hypothetical protein
MRFTFDRGVVGGSVFISMACTVCNCLQRTLQKQINYINTMQSYNEFIRKLIGLHDSS